MIEAIKNALGLMNGVVSWVLQSVGLRNTAEMQARDRAQKDADKDDEIALIIKNRDTEAAKKQQSP